MVNLRSTAVRVALLCVAVCHSAAAAELKIVGPDSVPIGGTAFFKLEGVKAGDAFDYFATPTSETLVVLFDIESTPIGVVNAGQKARTLTLVAVAYDPETKKVKRALRTVPIGVSPVEPVEPIEPTDPVKPEPDKPPPTTKATAVTFVYEKDRHEVPKPVLAALNKINREKKIPATILEADTTDGTGQVPEQYKAALSAAKEKGLPCLVVMAGDVVLSVTKDPKTEEVVLKAVQ